MELPKAAAEFICINGDDGADGDSVWGELLDLLLALGLVSLLSSGPKIREDSLSSGGRFGDWERALNSMPTALRNDEVPVRCTGVTRPGTTCSASTVSGRAGSAWVSPAEQTPPSTTATVGRSVIDRSS